MHHGKEVYFETDGERIYPNGRLSALVELNLLRDKNKGETRQNSAIRSIFLCSLDAIPFYSEEGQFSISNRSTPKEDGGKSDD